MLRRVAVVLLALLLAGAAYRYSAEIKQWWGFQVMALKIELQRAW